MFDVMKTSVIVGSSAWGVGRGAWGVKRNNFYAPRPGPNALRPTL